MHAADEFYLLAGAEPPAGDALEQYENGVGISAATIAEAEALVAAWTGAAPRRRTRRRRPLPAVTGVRLLTGTLARPRDRPRRRRCCSRPPAARCGPWS